MTALALLRDAVLAEECRRSFHLFVAEFWSEIEPVVPFEDNWHIEAICDHLMAVTDGRINNLLINVPPGTSKSTLVSVMWPAWEWASKPGLRFFGVSYDESLSIRDSELCKRIVQSDKYQRWYGDTMVKYGANQKRHYETTAGGWRLATTIGGRGTGQHPNRKIVDDPHNVKQSESDVQRQAALEYWDGTLSSRGLGLGAATVVIMQRLHEVDLTGHIMKSTAYKTGQWSHLVIPMEYEVTREYPTTALGFKDPRTRERELLWPKLFSTTKVANLAAELGEYRAAGQLQQRPAPDGGGILDTKHFQLWPADKPLPIVEYIVQSYDTAHKDGELNDPSAGEVWGIFTRNIGTRLKRCAILLDAWDEKLKYPALQKKIKADWRAVYGGDKMDPMNKPRRADHMLVEEKSSGIPLIQDLRDLNLPVKAYNPGNASKEQRAHLAAPLLESDCFYLIESRRERGKPVLWARPLLTQSEQFPNGEHDDYVDCFTQAAIWLKKCGQLEVDKVPDEEEEEHDYRADRAKLNPYGQ